jgi:arsenate reductase
MNTRPYKVLFVCTGNSARSILAEALLNFLSGGRFIAYSAGSHPAGAVNPLSIKTLEQLHLPTDGYRSKNWDEFSKPDSPELDFVITVCDKAAGEVCPVWPGQPMTAHWGVADPAAAEGTDEQRLKAFLDTAIVLKRRIELMLSLPLTSLDKLSLQSAVRDIGKRWSKPVATTNVLILCTHNSARSVLSEAMLNHWAGKRNRDVKAFSAGSAPSGRINPFALEALSNAGVDVTGYRSKSWDEFTTAGAPLLSIVITVCDNAAAESCPVFFGGNGQPVKVHWGYQDPSNAEGGEEGKRRAFELTRQAISYRMLQLIDIPFDIMNQDELHRALVEIGKS